MHILLHGPLQILQYCSCMYQCVLLTNSTFAWFSPAPVGLLSSSRRRVTQEGHPYTTAQVWVPGGLSGAFSMRSKSRNLSSNRRVAFRRARAEQDSRKPTCQTFCSDKPRHNNTSASCFPRSCSDGHHYACVRLAFAYGRMCAVYIPGMRIMCDVCYGTYRCGMCYYY